MTQLFCVCLLVATLASPLALTANRHKIDLTLKFDAQRAGFILFFYPPPSMPKNDIDLICESTRHLYMGNLYLEYIEALETNTNPLLPALHPPITESGYEIDADKYSVSKEDIQAAAKAIFITPKISPFKLIAILNLLAQEQFSRFSIAYTDGFNCYSYPLNTNRSRLDIPSFFNTLK